MSLVVYYVGEMWHEMDSEKENVVWKFCVESKT